jgi:hypothetical protein
MSDSRADDAAAIQAVLVDSYKAWEAGDAAGMVANYTPDATAIMTGSLRRQGRRDRRQRIRHPVRRRDRGSGQGKGERDLGPREAGRPVADRRLSQQPGACLWTVNPSPRVNRDEVCSAPGSPAAVVPGTFI